MAMVGASVCAGDLIAQQSGTITGIVLDDQGKPFPNALVSCTSVPAMVTTPAGRRVPAAAPVSSAVTTGVDGSFLIGGLAAATYHLCAYGLKNTDLGSCEWTQGTARIDLAAGQAVRGLQFQVAEGTLVTFQVQDSRGQIRDLADLRTSDGRMALAGGNFRVGVFVGNRYVQASLAATNGASREYQVAIPKNANARLFLDTSLNVADSIGAAVSAGRFGVTIAPAGQAEVTISLTIP
jgi:hypothetical protein